MNENILYKTKLTKIKHTKYLSNLIIKSYILMILFKKYTANIYLYSLKNDDTHIPNQQLCTRFVHSFFLCKMFDILFAKILQYNN